MKQTKHICILVALVVMSMSFYGCESARQVLGSVNSVLGGGTNSNGTVSTLDVINGLKQALEIGVGKGAATVSLKDGFLKNPNIKIPLPNEVQKAANTLRDIGLGQEVDKVVTLINRGAEDAAKGAKNIFITAIKQMTFQDAMGILKGGSNAATDYLKRTTSTKLHQAFKPIIQNSLKKVDATRHWKEIADTHNQIPFIKTKLDPNLDDYVTQKAMNGLFFMVAKEEAKIRKDPLARGTELLKKVFKLQDK